MRTKADVETITHSAEYHALQFRTDDHLDVWVDIMKRFAENAVAFTYYTHVSETPFTVREDNGKWKRVEDQQYVVFGGGIYAPKFTRVCDHKEYQRFRNLRILPGEGSRVRDAASKAARGYDKQPEFPAWLAPESMADPIHSEDQDLYLDGGGGLTGRNDPENAEPHDHALFEAAVAQQDDADIELTKPMLPGNVVKDDKGYTLKPEGEPGDHAARLHQDRDQYLKRGWTREERAKWVEPIETEELDRLRFKQIAQEDRVLEDRHGVDVWAYEDGRHELATKEEAEAHRARLESLKRGDTTGLPQHTGPQSPCWCGGLCNEPIETEETDGGL